MVDRAVGMKRQEKEMELCLDWQTSHTHSIVHELRKHEYLWDPRHRSYLRRDKKTSGLQDMAQCLNMGGKLDTQCTEIYIDPEAHWQPPPLRLEKNKNEPL